MGIARSHGRLDVATDGLLPAAAASRKRMPARLGAACMHTAMSVRTTKVLQVALAGPADPASRWNRANLTAPPSCMPPGARAGSVGPFSSPQIPDRGTVRPLLPVEPRGGVTVRPLCMSSRYTTRNGRTVLHRENSSAGTVGPLSGSENSMRSNGPTVAGNEAQREERWDRCGERAGRRLGTLASRHLERCVARVAARPVLNDAAAVDGLRRLSATMQGCRPWCRCSNACVSSRSRTGRERCGQRASRWRAGRGLPGSAPSSRERP